MVYGGRGGHAPPPLLPPTGSVVEDRDLHSNPNKRVADLGPPAVRLGKGRGRGRGGSAGPSRGGSVPRGIAPPSGRSAANQGGSTASGNFFRGSRAGANAASRGGRAGPSEPRVNSHPLPDRPADYHSGRGWITDDWRPSNSRDNWRDVPFRSSYDHGAGDRYHGSGRDDRYYEDGHDGRWYDGNRSHDDYGSYSPAGPSDYRDRPYSPSRPARQDYVDESYDALALSPSRRHRRLSDCDDDGVERPSPAKIPRVSQFDRDSPRKPPAEPYAPVEAGLQLPSYSKHDARIFEAPHSTPDTPAVSSSKRGEFSELPSNAGPSRPENTAANPPAPHQPGPRAKEEGIRPAAPGRLPTPPPVEKLKFKPTKPKPKQPPVTAVTASGNTAPSSVTREVASAQPVPAIRSDAKEEGITASRTDPSSTTAPSGEETDGVTRREGVISYKRYEVSPSCFATNKAAKATARDALVADVAQKLKKEERMITKVWWRDDGVGFDWVSTATSHDEIPGRTSANGGSLSNASKTRAPAEVSTPAKSAAALVGISAAVSTPTKGTPLSISKSGTLAMKTFTFPPGLPEHSSERLHFIERRILESSQLDSRFRPTVKVEVSTTPSCLNLSIYPLTPADMPVQPFERHWLLESKGSTTVRHFPTDNPIKDELGPQGKKWKSHNTQGQKTHTVPIPRLHEATAEEDLTLAEYIDFCRAELHAHQKYKIGHPTRHVICSREGRFLSITSRPINAQRTPIRREEGVKAAAPVSQPSGSAESKDKTETKRARNLEETTQDGPQSSKKAKVMPETSTETSVATPIIGKDPSLAPVPLARSPAKMPKLEPVSPVKRPVAQRATSPSPLLASAARHAPSAVSSTAAIIAPTPARQTGKSTAHHTETPAPLETEQTAVSTSPPDLPAEVPTVQPPTPQGTPGPDAGPDTKRATPSDEKSSAVSGLEAQLTAKLAKITQWTDLMDKYPDQRAHFQRQVDRMEHDIFDIHQQIEQAKAAPVP